MAASYSSYGAVHLKQGLRNRKISLYDIEKEKDSCYPINPLALLERLRMIFFPANIFSCSLMDTIMARNTSSLFGPDSHPNNDCLINLAIQD